MHLQRIAIVILCKIIYFCFLDFFPKMRDVFILSAARASAAFIFNSFNFSKAAASFQKDNCGPLYPAMKLIRLSDGFTLSRYCNA